MPQLFWGEGGGGGGRNQMVGILSSWRMDKCSQEGTIYPSLNQNRICKQYSWLFFYKNVHLCISSNEY